MSELVYLDYNATAKVRPEAIAAMTTAMMRVGNPSSIHAAGRAARATMETARGQVAALVGARADAVTFTSGGTEASAMAIRSAAAGGVQRIIVGATEHDCVRAGAEATDLPIEVWPVDGRGLADLGWLTERLAQGGPALVCLMLANNETGVIQPVALAASLVREAGGWLHVDAVQAAGKVSIAFDDLGADTAAISAHKLGGPQGVGALIAGPRATLVRQQHGGGQERGRRGGTENGPGIAGFGAAAAAASDLEAIAAQAAWRDELASRMVALGAVVVGEATPRLPQTLCIAMPGFASDVQVMTLDLAGVMISAGAACSSGKVKASLVVEAMALSDLASSAVRISGGWATRAEDWRACGDAWIAAHSKFFARRQEFA